MDQSVGVFLLLSTKYAWVVTLKKFSYKHTNRQKYLSDNIIPKDTLL